MSGRSVGAVVGGIIGSYFGPVGQAIGSFIGGAIGSYISPDVYNGPSIGDAQQQTTQAGVPRPVVYGHPAPFAGNIIDGEAKARKIKVKVGNGDGKGSQSYTKEEHFLLTYAIRICEGPIGGVARIWRNGKVVADFRSDADIPPYINGDTAARAKAIAEGRAATVKFMKMCRIYLGTEDQLPDPSLEQLHGVGNVPAYRGTAYIVLTDDDVTDTRGSAAQYQFEVFGVATSDDGSIVSLTDSDVIRRGIFGINTSGGIRTEYDPGENTYWPLTAKPGTPYRAYCHNDRSAPVRAVFRTSPGNNIIFDTGWVCTSASDAAALSAAITGTQYDGAISVVEYGPYPKGTSPIGYGTFTGDETGINWQWMVYNTNVGGVSAYLSIPDQDELPESWTTSPDLPDAYLGSDGKIYYPSWITPPELNVVTNVGLTVGDVVSDIAQRCGVTPNEVDVAVLSETIPGLLVATQCSGAEAIKPIEQLFFFDLPEYDGNLRAIKRGGPITATITDDDIVDADDETTRSQQAEYPAKVYVVTRVPESEYSPIPQVSSRFSNEVVATSEVRIESPIPLSPNAAASAATIIQACLWTQLEGKTELSLPEQFTWIVTSDRIQYDNRSWLVTKLTYADGVVKLSLSYDRANDYKLTAAGVAGQAPALPSSSLSEATTFVPMQLPPLRESDIGKVGIYVTACGTSDAWAGCAVQISLDGGVTVTQIGYITRPSDIGETTSSVSESDSTFSVDLIYGELNSLPEVSLESGGNSAALVEANGIGEIVQHLDATEVADNEYSLSGVNRGVLFTEDESHASGTRYTTLANAMFVPISSALVGKDVMVRCPTIGTDPNTSAWKTLTLKDMSKKSIKYPNPINLYEVVEAPYLNAVASLSPTDLALLPSSVGFVVSMAAPRGAEIDYSMIVDPGTGTYSDVGRSGWAATAVPFYLLMLPFSQTDTILPNLALSGNRLDKVTSGMIGFWDGEVVITTTDGSSGSVGIKRGCADTVPAVHESNTRIWFYDVGHIFGKDKYSDGQTINVKLLSNTDTAQLIPEFAEPIPITFNQRFNRPYPPGKLRITDSVATDAAYPTDCVGALTITWAHRNRITQGATLVDESAASVTPESGTTYTVRYYLNDVLEHTESGITGTAATPYTLSGDGTARIEVESVRGGVASWQAATAEFAYLRTLLVPYGDENHNFYVDELGNKYVG